MRNTGSRVSGNMCEDAEAEFAATCAKMWRSEKRPMTEGANRLARLPCYSSWLVRLVTVYPDAQLFRSPTLGLSIYCISADLPISSRGVVEASAGDTRSECKHVLAQSTFPVKTKERPAQIFSRSEMDDIVTLLASKWTAEWTLNKDG